MVWIKSVVIGKRYILHSLEQRLFVCTYMYTSHYPEGAVYPEKDGKIAIQELEFKFLTGL